VTREIALDVLLAAASTVGHHPAFLDNAIKINRVARPSELNLHRKRDRMVSGDPIACRAASEFNRSNRAKWSRWERKPLPTSREKIFNAFADPAGPAETCIRSQVS
jgi:hypothetical protein